MGRRFTAASSERIQVGSAGLAGFNFLFGTFAAWVNITSYPTGGNYGAFATTNAGSGACFEASIVAGTLKDLFDGTNDRTAAGPTAGATVLVGTTKASGTATARTHLYVPSTNTWTHGTYSGTSVNSATVTALTLGNEQDSNTAGLGSLNAEVWQIAMWSALVMSDGEFERLARTRDWKRLGPDFFDSWSDGREQGDMANTLGRFNVRQTGRTGTTRGTATRPPGMGTYPPRHRR